MPCSRFVTPCHLISHRHVNVRSTSDAHKGSLSRFERSEIPGAGQAHCDGRFAVVEAQRDLLGYYRDTTAQHTGVVPGTGQPEQ